MEADTVRAGLEEQEGFSLLDQVQADLNDVARALERLDEGTYGSCQACGAPIDEELMKATPTARRCPECPSG